MVTVTQGFTVDRSVR